MVQGDSFGERLRFVRLKKGVTQTELAEVLGFGPSAISNYETGANEPGFGDLIRICHYLDVTPNQLLGFTKLRLNEQEYNNPILIKGEYRKKTISITNICRNIEELMNQLVVLQRILKKQTKRYLLIEEIEDGMAICRTAAFEEFIMPVFMLPKGLRKGSIVQETRHGCYILCKQNTKEVRNSTKKKK